MHAAAFVHPRPWDAAEFAALLRQPHSLLEGAEDGFVLLRVLADEAEVLTLAVAPHARRRGLATGLLARAMARAADHGARAAFLEVAAGNAAARALYARAGFEQVGLRAGYYGGEDALVLHRRLAP
nr:GNAT family N-acetyltransferase [Rhodobaculum claviforme]